MAVSEQIATCPQHGPFTRRNVVIAGKDVVLGSCPTCAKARDHEQAQREERDRIARHKAMLHTLTVDSRIPARYSQSAITVPDGATPAHQQIVSRAQWFIDTWAERKSKGTGLVLCGKPGTGKTHLACAIGLELIRRGESVLFVSVSEAMREIRETYNAPGKSEAQVLRTFTQPALLILDEVGAGNGSDHEKQQLFEIVNRRYADLRSTVLVSNLESTMLLQYLGDRLMDRMREGGGKMMVFDWQSLRK